MLNILRTFKLKVSQAALYELAVVSIGIIIGSHWPEFFTQYRTTLFVIFILAGGYVFHVWWKQVKS